MARRNAARPRGFREAQQDFAAPVDIRSVFRAYGDACAFTGIDLAAEARADPRGYLVILGNDPFADAPNLLIPACLDARHAFERGHLAIGPRYNFLADLERIDPGLLERLNPIGRLRLPDIAAYVPLASALAEHRRLVSDGADWPEGSG